MRTLKKGYRGLWLVADLNEDLLFWTVALAVALGAGSLIGSML
ncbi:hypothetical protein SAMN05216257_106109 [Meinhardsimonia xiamenensis]|jgi:hypothetical protein|uniref:Uncharacterized protein n=1 Tax=Meinhardsimonia xiamenensis TaxID=990712 RepID=A0A1G9G5L6_9RHOB|nr:hypothetical protein [Meinhardsimonia xiamenensis]PRX32668.1 hypothetical protein LV81_02429 [Meinhardsimonia xiamenensis]SDK95970.1 hypothetical protein SAMN05216257_106109 [Meinhardsimonia xiamenensis]